MERTGHLLKLGALTVALCGVGLALPRCGGDDLGPIEVNLTKDNYCEQISEVVCRNMFRCCTRASIEKVLGQSVSPTEEDCRKDVALICQRFASAAVQGLAAGTVTLTQSATPCLKSYLVTEDQCFPTLAEAPWTKACEDPSLEGRQGDGKPCKSVLECKKDHTCDSGICRALPKEGKECRNGQCASGLYCDGSENKCKPRGKNGDKCEPGKPCAKQHYCKMDQTKTPPEGVCKALGDKGAACDKNSECRSGRCGPGTCQDATSSSCTTDSQCGMVCKGTKTKCTPGSGQCTTGTCSGSGKKCDPSKPGPCPTGDTCVAGNCTNAGVSCSDQCASGESCNPAPCVKAECGGKRTCADTFSVVDFCQTPPKQLLGL